MEREPEPALSVILATPDDFDTIRKTTGHLRAQTACHRIELVVVAPDAPAVHMDDADLEGLWGVQLIELPGMDAIGEANAAGVRAAKAPVVALAEDHAFPEPEWGEALIAAYQGDQTGKVAAVGPVICNANPRTLVSWADLYLSYAPWLDPSSAGEQAHLPGHNSSYKRTVLLGYGSQLEAMMAAESVLHWDLRRKGYRLLLEPDARTRHTNFSRLPSLLHCKYHSGRVFGASRVRGWPMFKRLAYAAGSPLIPLVRLRQIIPQVRRAGHSWWRIVRVMPTMLLGLASSALGEMTGYAFGSGRSAAMLAGYEFYRAVHLSETDRADPMLMNTGAS